MANKIEQIAFRNQQIIYQLFKLLSDKVSWLSVFFFVFVFACLVVFFKPMLFQNSITLAYAQLKTIIS